MKYKLIKLKSLKTIFILGVVVMIVLLIFGYIWLAKIKEEKFIKSQTFDSINKLQEFPSQKTIKKLKILTESSFLDSYLRERAIFVLTDISIKLEKNSETRDYLKKIALNQEMPVNLHSAALANLDLIDQLFPPKKHGMMNVDVQGEIKLGGQISIIIRLLSDIDVENVKVGAGGIKHYSPMLTPEKIESPIITPITKPPWWKGSIKANALKELKFDFRIEKEGEIEFPVVYEFNFDSIDSETEKQSLYFKITKTGGEFSRASIFK